MKITIYGEPIAKMRPRFFVRGRHVGCYDLQEKEKRQVQREIIAQLHEAMNSEDKQKALEASEIAQKGSFAIWMRFYMSVPKSGSKKAINASLWNFNKCLCKKDLDNCEKFLLDALNGILYSDDHLITELHSIKLYSENPRTEITIMSNDTPNYNETRQIIVHFSPDEITELHNDAEDLVLILRHFLIYNNPAENDYENSAKALLDFSKKYAPVMTKISKLKFEEKT
jgi:Holliday junction resolvase RusA-like endonuclease